MRHFLLSLLSLASFGLFGQSTAPASAPTLTDTTLLWRIGGGDDAAPSYLFGTIHLIPADDYFLPDPVVRAINDAEEIYFEVDPRDMQNPAKMMGLMGKLTMRGDTSLADLLSPARYDSVAAYFTDAGLPFFMFKKMKPMFLSAMVGQDMAGGNPLAGGGSMKSYELELTKIAEAADKPIGGLETMDYQLGLFDSIPYAAQAEMLYEAVAMDALGSDGDAPNQLEEMVGMYKRRAVAEMSTMISDESAKFGNFEELLVTKRNENWVPLILARLATPSVYAVGAGHLGGTSGVIALLRAAGIPVEPVF